MFKRSMLAAAILVAASQSAGANVITPSSWTVLDNKGHLIAHESGSPQTIAREQIDALRKKGLLTAYAKIDDTQRVIRILRAKPAVTGPLADYISKDRNLSIPTIKRDLPLITDAAYSMGSIPAIKVDRVHGDTLPVAAGVIPSEKPYTYGFIGTSYGPRYSGSDVASAFVQGGFDHMIGSLTYSEGLAFLTPTDSKGGYYHGVSGSLTRPFSWGELVAGGHYAVYKEGGKSLPLDITGTDAQVYAGYERPFSWGKPGLHLMYGKQTSLIGVADISGEQHYTAVQAVFSGNYRPSLGLKDRAYLNVDTRLTQGLSAGYSGYALGRLIQRDFGVATLDLVMNQSIGSWMIGMAGGGQIQHGVEPDQLDFYLGGVNRGSGYFTGAASSLSGAYGGARLYVPTYHTTIHNTPVALRPFVGYNQSVGEPAIGNSLRAASAELGTQLKIGKNLSGEVGYAWITDHDGAHDSHGRVIFNIVASF